MFGFGALDRVAPPEICESFSVASAGIDGGFSPFLLPLEPPVEKNIASATHPIKRMMPMTAAAVGIFWVIGSPRSENKGRLDRS